MHSLSLFLSLLYNFITNIWKPVQAYKLKKHIQSNDENRFFSQTTLFFSLNIENFVKDYVLGQRFLRLFSRNIQSNKSKPWKLMLNPLHQSSFYYEISSLFCFNAQTLHMIPFQFFQPLFLLLACVKHTTYYQTYKAKKHCIVCWKLAALWNWGYIRKQCWIVKQKRR